MTTPNTDLAEQIAVALYNNAEYYGPEDVQPEWECLGDEEREEWRLIAAAALPIVAAAVKRGQAKAWRSGHTTGFEDALLACEIATGVKPGPPPGPTPNPYEETP